MGEKNVKKVKMVIRKEVRYGDETYPYKSDMGLSANGREEIEVTEITFVPTAPALKKAFNTSGEIVKIQPRDLVKTEDGGYKVEGRKVQNLCVLGYYQKRDILALEVKE